MNRTTLTVLGGALLLALAGCSSAGGDGIASAGGTSSAAQGTAQVSDEEQAREFAKCMRDHGIDLPDPQPDGNGGFDWGAGMAGVDFNDPAFQEAINACRDKLPGGGREVLDDPEVQAQLQEFAQCMRDNGMTDFPDPDPEGGFGGAFAELDRNSPEFQSALDACRDKLPERGGQ
jgi:hypothetical protein